MILSSNSPAMPNVIEIRNLGKRYRICHNAPADSYKTLRESLVHTASTALDRIRGRHGGQRVKEFWALRGVDVDVDEGEVVGIIGRNGAGKSTMLKILSRIAKPTTGRATLRGRTSSLLEVGTGFHQELTGRENIYLNGAILGMSRAEIAKNFDAIVDFSGVEEFLDMPVKRYSSGMQVRLAFSVAAHLEPEILIVDEVLAVGDAEFQRRCLGRMERVAKSGRTILFVSHNMQAVRSITTRCVFLKRGEVHGDGPTEDMIGRYLEETWTRGESSGEVTAVDDYRRDRNRDSSVTIRRLEVLGGRGSPPTLDSGDPIVIRFEVLATRAIRGALLNVILTNHRGERVVTLVTLDQNVSVDLEEGVHTLDCRVQDLPLAPGKYTMTAGINRTLRSRAYDVIVDYPAFRVAMPGLENGEIEWPQRPWGCIHWKNVSWSSSPISCELSGKNV
jgi:lipopolysaccharide transport system ATP-binding protein